MSNVLIDRQKIDILANAISDKSGVPITMTLDEMVEAVDSIEAGGGSAEPVLQAKTYTVDSAGTETITADSGYDGLSSVSVSVPSAEPWLGVESKYETISGQYSFRQRSLLTVDPFEGEKAGFLDENTSLYSDWITYPAIQGGTVITPTESRQELGRVSGATVIHSTLTVDAIPSNYVGSGITQRSSSDLTASGATVTVPSGYYSAQASKAVSSGSATPASTISATGASVSTGTNTLTLSKSVSNTPTVSAGYISSGTAGNSSVSLTASVTTQAAQTIYPSTSDQTISASRYLTGAQTIKAVTTSNLTAENIKSGVTVTVGDSADADRVASVTGTYTGGGGSGGLTLLSTTSLGTLSTTSTSAADTGKSLSLTGYGTYDLLIVDVSVDTPVNGRHTSTVSMILLTGTSNVDTKNTYTVASNKWNSKLGSTGTGSTRQSTTAYGIYANSASVSSNTMTIPLYYRYNSNSTGTLNGTYTARIYGVKLYDLIGG